MSVTVPLGPAKVDITGVRAGDRNLMTVTITSKGQAVDLSGKTLEAQARVKATDEEATVTAVIDVTDAAAGEAELRWPGDEVTAALAGKGVWNGVWDLQLLTPGEDPLTVCAGKFGAEMDVTR